ncbi:MAG TPA: hypothetical protein VGQ81_05010 [Acidobacteriota bacterium]|nr:hypothetical protein [Acidobacteriota bacterium]
MTVNRTDEEELMIRSLLGELSEEEQIRLEKLFFTKDEYFDQLLALENELMYDYAQGRLSERERSQFEKRFLASPEGRKQAEHAEAFLKKVSELRPAVASREPSDQKRSLIALLGFQKPIFKWSLAAAALVLVFGFAWLAFENARLRTEVREAEAGRASRQKDLERQTASERVGRDQLSQELERERDKRAQLEQELAKQQADQRMATKQPSSPAVLSLILAPGLVRDTSGPKRLLISPGADLLEIQLDIKKKVDYKSYRAVLRTADGDEVWSQDMLHARPTDSGRAVFLKLPPRIIPAGDYELALTGVASNRDFERVASYYFTVVKR